MKKNKLHLFISITVLIITIYTASFVDASFKTIPKLTMPFGGKIITTKSPVITCASTYGPLTMQPITKGIPGISFISKGDGGTPKTGSYILGNYELAPNVGTCYNTETGAPVPAFSIKTYGVSR